MATLIRAKSLLFVLCLLGASVRADSIYEDYTFGTLAGNGPYGYADGTHSAARFHDVNGVATDSRGNTYVADQSNSVVRKITRRGVVTTFAGVAGFPGFKDGVGTAAQFDLLKAVAVDGADNVYVADAGNYVIRKITPDGMVTTIAGVAGARGTNDGVGSAARFYFPAAVAAQADGTLFVADSGAIRKITPDTTVTTFAGSVLLSGANDGVGTEARFLNPIGIGIDSQGNLFIGDSGNSTIRKITPAAVVTTFAGLAGVQGTEDGTGSAARFHTPAGVAVDRQDSIFVADQFNSTIRKIPPTAVVTTFAGSALNPGYDDGKGTAARFDRPLGLAVDRAGNLRVSDLTYNLIRTISRRAVVTTLAGLPGGPGTADGVGSAARFYNPYGIAVGGNGTVYVVDTFSYTLRAIAPGAAVSTLAGSPGKSGSADGVGSNARFFAPQGNAVDGAGNIYVADTINRTIRKVTPDGIVTTLAGSPGVLGSTDGQGAEARFNNPSGVAALSDGTLFVADTLNHTIRQISPGGLVTTLAGSPGASGSRDGNGSQARFNAPEALAVDSNSGTVYVADTDNQTIRKITPAGAVTTLAGTAGRIGSDDGLGGAARFYKPQGVAVDQNGTIYVSDTSNNTIRKITTAGSTTTLAGIPSPLVQAEADGTGATARFYNPSGIAVDSNGTLYLCDTFSQTIRIGVPAR